MADMLPVVSNTHFERLCAVDDYTSFIWTTRYYEPGDFELTVPMSSHNLQYLLVGHYVMRGDDDSEMGIIERREVTQDLNGQETMTVSGRFLSSILARRIIAQQTQVSGTIAHCVSQLINVSAINPSDTARKLPIRIGTLDIPATEMQQQFTGTNLLEAIVNICKTYFVGFSLHYDADTGSMVFDMFDGIDRSYGQSENTYAVFSSEYGNLQSSDYVEDASAIVTNVLVAGEGEGLERKTIWASKGNPTGLSRYELFQDARNASTNDGAISDEVYYKQLQDEGMESIADMAQMFAGQVTFDNIEFGTDLNIGDICTIESVSWGMYMDARLIEVIESVGETGAYTITPSFEAVSAQGALRDAALLTESGNIRITSESGARLLAQTRALSATGGEVKISELEEATTLNADDAIPVATDDATVKATIETLTTTMLKATYPVGSIYLNATNATNPATLLGFGTWQRLGQGRMMIDANGTYGAGDTGGSATHNHGGTTGSTKLTAAQSGLPAHTHGFTNPKIPNHAHSMAHTHPTISSGRVIGYNYGTGSGQITSGVTATRVTPASSGTHYVPQVANASVDFSGFDNTGSSSAANTGNPTSLGATTGGAVGAVTDGAKAASSGHDHSISSASNMPPWIGVYMWVRTA